jgi:hypothetical protein
MRIFGEATFGFKFAPLPASILQLKEFAMSSDELNRALESVRALIVKGQRIAAEEILDALPVAVQLLPTVLSLHNEVRMIRQRANQRGLTVKRSRSKSRSPRSAKAKISQHPSEQPRPSPASPGVIFVPVQGAGIAGGLGFRCVVIEDPPAG